MPTRIPRLIPGVDVRKLPLTPTDGYLLTRVNGQSTVGHIARETGIFETEVVEAFEKLVNLRVVTFGSVEEALAEIQREANKPAPLKAAVLTARYDPRELDEMCDLDGDQKRRVLDLFYALEDNDYYTLLGVAREADKKTVKKAYYDVALPMHPDKFFRKNLGTFKVKMEVVFAKLTLAHDTLSDKTKRADYDVYLKEVAHTKGMEAMLARAMAEARAAEEAAIRAAGAPSQFPPPKPPSEPPPPGMDPAVLAARKAALAARLMGGRPRAGSSHDLKPPTAQPLQPVVRQSADQAVDALKRRYHERIADAKASQVTKYVEAAEAAIAKLDWVAASNAYKVALEFSDDAELRQRAAGAEIEANKILAESYTKQADYDERNERWPEAARAWTKVAKLKPDDAKAHIHAANAILKADGAEGDLRDAAQYAQNAVNLQPTIMSHRMLLANIFVSAGKPALAKRELENAAQVSPNDPAVQALLKRLK
jgi:curved DNA-binding protein CbpA